MHFDRIFWLRLLQLGGLTLLAMGIWVSVDGGSFLQLLGPFARQGMQFVNVGFFCIAIGVALVLLGLLGCCGAHKESKCLLLMVGTPDLVRGGPGLLILMVDQHRSCCGIRQPFRSLTSDLISSVSLQFFAIILIIFVAEMAAGVVALAYSSFVSPPSAGWPEVIAWPRHLLHFLFRNTETAYLHM